MRKLGFITILLTLFISACTTTLDFKISFDTVGGTSVAPTYVLPGRTILIPSTTKEGHTLDGWYTSVNGGVTLDERWSFTNNSVNNDITLYAKWNINTYTITFDTMLGSTIAPRSFNYNETVVMPTQPTRTGYTFTGWDQDIPSKMPAENITIKALWVINTTTITFDTDGGNIITSITQDFNTTITIPDNPTRESYTFDGWYSNASFTTPYVFTTMASENITLYAKWTPILYNMTYELDGGVNGSNPTSYHIETPTITLANPTKEGHTFNGWFNNSALTGLEVISIPQGSIGNSTIYAKWTINQYMITYNTYDNYDPLNDIPLEEGETVVSVSLGGTHSSAVTSTGRVFMWGSNGNGQLGDGTTTDHRNTPTEITSRFSLSVGETVVSVSLGNSHSSALTSTGRVFMWGWNVSGQLGDGTTTTRSTPTEITSRFSLSVGETVVSVSLGIDHSSALTSTGRVFMWGWNLYGRLGDGTSTTRNTPTEITSRFSLSVGETVVSVSLGGFHSSALTSTGRVFMWGWNGSGRLGDGTTTDRSTPTEITSQFSLSVGETVVSVSLGRNHSSALTSTGRVFMWGWNGSGRLGDGTTIDRNTPTITAQFSLSVGETVVSVSLGGLHSSALTSTGRVFMWGSNGNGQLGDGTTTTRRTPTNITSRFGLSVGETVVSVSLGGDHSSALTSTGRIFMWGYNLYGRLGDGTTTDRNTPTNIPFKTIFSTTKTLHLFNELLAPTTTREGYTFDGWYSNASLTTAYEFTNMPAENITLYGKWRLTLYNITYDLDGGVNGDNPSSYHIETSTITLANPTKEGHTFNGWFNNSALTGLEVISIPQGSIGNSTLYAKWTINQYMITYNTYDNYDPLNDIPLEEGETFVSVSLGDSHSSALTSTGRVFMWGNNFNGQLGDGTTTRRSTPTNITSRFDLSEGERVVSVSLGRSHSSAITSTGRVFMWGSNNNGQLGDGTTTDRNTPTEITSRFSLSVGETIVSVSLGSLHSSALTSTGRVFMWGSNGGGQLGDGTFTTRTTPTEITSRFSLSVGETVVSVSLGGFHSSALTSTGRIFMWGSNFNGQFGDGTRTSTSTPTEIISQFSLSEGERVVSVSLGNSHSSALTSTGRIFMWGLNDNRQLGDGTRTSSTSTPRNITSQFSLSGGERVVSVSLGGNHSSALTSTGRVFMWGLNSRRQLGDGTGTTRTTPTEITARFSLSGGERVVSVSLGGFHSSALTSTGRVFMWGWNDSGQLGDGTTTHRSTPTNIPFKTAFSTTKTLYVFNESLVAPTPTREGYTFDDWYSNASPTTAYIFTNMPAENIALYARWIPKS